jgi:hypothetical protein
MGKNKIRHMSVQQRPTFQLLNHMTYLKKKTDATPTNQVQFDKSNNNMADKKKLRWERQ